jgi:cytoskeletal protein CcmA (bactofilin family)
MPARKPEKILLSCPHCGHQQSEPNTVLSTNCRACGRHFTIEEVPRPGRKVADKAAGKPERGRQITCFDCGTDLDVAVSAESTMCKRCGRYVDLKDYRIANAVSKNFKTKGAFVLEAKGYVFNTEATVGEAVIKGRFLGKLIAERSLTIYATAEFKGTFKAGRLIIPAQNHFRWPEPIRLGSAEIAGELAADLCATDTVVLKSTAHLFGDVVAKNLVVEAGAVVVGRLRVGTAG